MNSPKQIIRLVVSFLERYNPAANKASAKRIVGIMLKFILN